VGACNGTHAGVTVVGTLAGENAAAPAWCRDDKRMEESDK